VEHRHEEIGQPFEGDSGAGDLPGVVLRNLAAHAHADDVERGQHQLAGDAVVDAAGKPLAVGGPVEVEVVVDAEEVKGPEATRANVVQVEIGPLVVGERLKAKLV